jgi:hypothetical protein
MADVPEVDRHEKAGTPPPPGATPGTPPPPPPGATPGTPPPPPPGATPGTAAPPRTADGTVETWQTRPESIGAFLGNLLLCTLFPIVALWYGPRYVMRNEYLKAFVCVAVPLVLISLFVLG